MKLSDSIVRSGVLLVVGLPITLAVANGLFTNAGLQRSNAQTSVADTVAKDIKGSLTDACVKFMVSKTDSKLERTAQNTIDDTLGGEVNHVEVCKWVLG